MTIRTSGELEPDEQRFLADVEAGELLSVATPALLIATELITQVQQRRGASDMILRDNARVRGGGMGAWGHLRWVDQVPSAWDPGGGEHHIPSRGCSQSPGFFA